MPITQIPSIDNNVCSGWTEQQITLFNRLDFYFAKMQVEQKKTYPTFSKLVGKINWTPNQGSTMKAVRKESSPHIRQFAFPNAITSVPTKDVIDVREVTTSVEVYKHRFETPTMSFIPSFRDFMTDHVDFHAKDIAEKQSRYNDIFIRGRMFHESPHVFFPNRASFELVSSPIAVGNNAAGSYTYEGSTTGKSVSWLQARLAEIGNPGNLSLCAVNLALTIMENDLRIPAFMGNSLPKDDQGLADKYCLVLSGEAWNQFTFDPWMLANKPLNLDVVHNGFKGSLWGRITCKIEDLPIRISADGTFPVPQLRVADEASQYNAGETVNNPAYNNAPYEVAFLVGAKGYDAIEVGPPPAAFAKNGMPAGFGKMFWNGEIEITKNILLECVDTTGAVKYALNQYGEYLQLISQTTYGVLPRQRRSVVPIIFKRRRGC